VEHREYTKEQAEAYMEGYNELKSSKMGSLKKEKYVEERRKHADALDEAYADGLKAMEGLENVINTVNDYNNDIDSYDNESLLDYWKKIDATTADSDETYMKEQFAALKEKATQFMADNLNFDDNGDAVMKIIEDENYGALGSDFALRVLERTDATPGVAHKILDYTKRTSRTEPVKDALINGTGYKNRFKFHFSDFMNRDDGDTVAGSVEQHALDDVDWTIGDLEHAVGKNRLWKDGYYEYYADKAARRAAPPYLDKDRYVKLRGIKPLNKDDKKYFMKTLRSEDTRTRRLLFKKIDYDKDGSIILEGVKRMPVMELEMFNVTADKIRKGEPVYQPLVHRLSLDNDEIRAHNYLPPVEQDQYLS
jgi:hypothetical protein